MPQVIIALYESARKAEAAVKRLEGVKPLSKESISLLTYESSHSTAAGHDKSAPSFLARLMGNRRDIAGVREALTKLGVSDSDAQNFAEGLRRRHALVAVQADESRIQEVHSLLQAEGPIDITERAQQWRQAGWTGFQADADLYTDEEAAAERQRYVATAATTGRTGEEQVLPVMEEKLVVGKRAVEQGGVRVYTRVVETPVEETVTLREEHVSVERRPVDRPVDVNTLDTFKEGTIEVTARGEEAVVAKQARIIEEVVVHKEVGQRTETIRDTVRRTEVQVEDTHQQVQSAAQRTDTAYDQEGFRTHYTSNFANSGYTYEQFTPAYRFGHTLASHERYRGKDWSAVESDAQRYWEERNPGTWENFKQAVRHAWDSVPRDRSDTGPA